jgi:hypothetical protein
LALVEIPVKKKVATALSLTWLRKPVTLADKRRRMFLAL